MNHLFRYVAFAGLAMAIFFVSSCSEDDNPLFTAGADYADGAIYDKSDGDSDGSTGSMDYNGYTYKVVRIGNQWWMAENLRTTRYNDGSVIPNVTDEDGWSDLTTGAWCDYNNDPGTGAEYGKIYNWFAVNTGKLAPPGWRVPKNEEWESLSIYLGGELAAGGPMKEEGTAHWNSPNSGATNESGFTALGGGGRFDFGPFYAMGDNAFFWASSGSGDSNAWYRTITSSGTRLVRNFDDRTAGYSVRCVQN